jgi:hypothetical protein
MHKNTKNRNYKNLSLLLLALVVVQSPLTVLAKDKKPPANLQPLEDIPPPAIADDGNLTDEPQVTIVKKKNGDTVEEYRIGGQLYMMKITPSHGVPYYMHREDQEGGWINDGPSQPLSIPKWTLFRF